MYRCATQILCGLYGNDEKIQDAVILAEELLEAVESREAERAKDSQ